ncbi:sensor histidine kinase [Fodinicurvata fenggangensis]|uniref:sensor histidine kinase n=1 Tax=Fodinicurvata fenggangensis TaxID=1121830 RepID=UPI000B17CCD5|nr:ATP-binding protein [Fodinicurvata fenggangensis]
MTFPRKYSGEKKKPRSVWRQLWPVAILVMGFLGLAAALVYDTAWHQYELALESERRIVEKGLSLHQKTIANHTVSGAHDDDSIENLLLDYDPDWAEEYISEWALDGLQMDGALVTWGGNRILHHVNQHASSHLADPAAFPREIKGLIETARNNAGPPGERPEAATSFFRDEKGLHLVAAAPLTWEDTRGHALEGGEHAVLIIFMTFDQAFLTDLASDLELNGLRLTSDAPADSRSHLPLRTADGQTLASLTWASTSPDLGMLREMVLPLAIAGLAMLVLSAFFVRHAYRRARLFEYYHGLLEERTEELKQSKEHAEALSRSKSRFLATMSHELRTPLNAILGFSDLLRQDFVKSLPIERIQDYARDIHASGNYLLSLINDILDLSKIEAERYELHEEKVQLSELVEESLSMVQSMAEHNTITLHNQVTDCTLQADPRALKQVLVNLLSNALKYSEPETNVWIDNAFANDGKMTLRVRDQGQGMSAEDIAKALEAFGRTEDAYIQGIQGTGLGLNICQSIMQLHEGTLDIESAPGQGTSVILQVPAERILTASQCRDI